MSSHASEANHISESPCASVSCGRPASNVSVVSGLRLCQAHLDKELAKATKRQLKTVEKLRNLFCQENKVERKTELQILETELQEVNDAFDQLQEKLQDWRQRTVSRVQSVHESVAQRLKDAQEAEEWERQINCNGELGNVKKVMETIQSIEFWLDEAQERLAVFGKSRLSLNERQSCSNISVEPPVRLRCIGDVSSGVRNLQFMFDRHMTGLMHQCWLDDGEKTDTEPPPLCRPLTTISDLPHRPKYVVSCCNTAGYASDASGRVIRVDKSAAASQEVPLPQPCLFVAFQGSENNPVKFLQAISLDGSVRLVCNYSSDAVKADVGLHCDSKRQLLFAASTKAVVVTDLSAAVIRIIDFNSFRLTEGRFTGLDGNEDKVFVLDSGNQCLIAVDKDSGELQFTVDIKDWDASIAKFYRPTIHGSKVLLVCDTLKGAVYKLCAISGRLIAPYPSSCGSKDAFKRPWQVVVDARGLMFVSELENHNVRVLSCDGTVQQTLGSPGDSGCEDHRCNGCVGLCLAEDSNRRLLIVSDFRNKRLKVFVVL